MNNAFVIKDNVLDEEQERDPSPYLNERVQQLTDIIDALQNVAASSYWKVLQKYEFDDTLESLLVELGDEKDSVKIFRLQGEIRRAKKYNLLKMITERREELERVRNQLHGR